MAQTPVHPDIIIYLVDTLRRDHLEVYGYHRATSPRLAEFAEGAVVFERAYSTSGWTKPAVASLFTGLNPARHGAVTRTNILPEEVTVLADHFRLLGYHTAAVFTNPNVAEWCGFAQGFDDVMDVREITADVHVDADTVNEHVMEYLGRDHDAPLFLFVHTMDPHGPYDPAPPYDTRFTETPAEAIRPHRLNPDAPDDSLRNTVAQYDGEIAFNDEQFGQLMDFLKHKNLFDESLIVFVSDHGEEFLDHQLGGHSHSVYEELVRIPLIVKFPSGDHARLRIDHNVGLIDVFPTLLGYLGREPPPNLDGENLMPLLEGQEFSASGRRLFFDLDTDRPDNIHRAVRGVLAGSHKFIRWTLPEPQEMLFDLADDPTEQSDLISSQPGIASTLGDLLRAHVTGSYAGIHFRLINDGGTKDRVVQGRLTTDGEFVGFRTTQLEDADTIELAEDAKSISFRCSLVNRPHPLGRRPKWIVDEDEISFRLEPRDAGVTIEEFSIAEMAQAQVFCGPDQKPVQNLPALIRQNDSNFFVDDASDFFRHLVYGATDQIAGGYLVIVPSQTGQETQIPVEINEQLRALGYLTDDRSDGETDAP
jgi:arylsulfatase A-like enzyme